MHVRDGDKSNGNDGCDPQEALKPMSLSRVRIQLRDKQVAVYVNDAQVCKAARQDRAAYKKAVVYAADPYVCSSTKSLSVIVTNANGGIDECEYSVAGSFLFLFIRLVCRGNSISRTYARSLQFLLLKIFALLHLYQVVPNSQRFD